MDLQKRTFLAVVLSILIIIVYSSLTSKFYPIVNKEVTENIPNSSLPHSQSKPQPAESTLVSAKPEVPHLKLSLIKFETPKVTYQFSPAGGNLISAKFKDYNYETPSTFLLGTQEWQELEFTPEIGQDSIFFKYKDSQKEITKKYKFSENGYYINFDIIYNNLTSSAVSGYYKFSLELKSLPAERFGDIVTFFNDGNILYINTLRNKIGFSRDFSQSLKWAGLRSKYFAYILSPISSKNDSIRIEKLKTGNDLLNLYNTSETIPAGSSRSYSFLYYCGPQKEDLLLKSGTGFEYVYNFGKLDVFVKFLLKILIGINKLVHNWGVAIILLAVIIYLCLYPLSIKQMRSMKKMQLVQPEIEALRKQYKNDAQKLNKEIMELYKKHNVNPLGGCLPILFQLPIFYALFLALSRGIEFKGANFLWIKDLSEPDRFMVLGGKDINLLPVLMIIAMFFQQKMSMSNLPASQSEQQKMMLWMMPAIFGIMFYSMPSGLVLYWFLNSLLSMVSQWKALK